MEAQSRIAGGDHAPDLQCAAKSRANRSDAAPAAVAKQQSILTHTSLLPCVPLNADRMVKSGSITDDLGSEAMTAVRARWWLHHLAVRLRPVRQTWPA
jgi:hypothetical protein